MSLISDLATLCSKLPVDANAGARAAARRALATHLKVGTDLGMSAEALAVNAATLRLQAAIDAVPSPPAPDASTSAEIVATVTTWWAALPPARRKAILAETSATPDAASTPDA